MSPSLLRVLRTISPDLGAATSPNFRSWLLSLGSYLTHASWVWKRRLDLIYVVRHEVIVSSHPFLLLLLVVEFSTTFYSLFRLPWLCSCRRFYIYTDHVHPIIQTMRIRLSHPHSLKHTSPTKFSSRRSLRLRNSPVRLQRLISLLRHRRRVSNVLRPRQRSIVRQASL